MDAAVGAKRLALPNRLRSLLLTLTVAAGVGLVGATVAISAPGADWWLVPLLVAVGTLSRIWTIRLFIGGNGIKSDWSEAVLIAGFALVHPSWVILAAAAGAVLAALWLRIDPVKAWFNIATHVVAVSAAALCMIALAGSEPDPLTLTGAVALTVMAVVAAVISEVATSAAVAFASSTPIRTVLFDGVGARLLGILMNLAIGVAVVAVVWYVPWLLLVMPVVLWLLIEGFAGRVRAGIERRMWQQLTEATRAMSQLDIDAVLRSAITESAALFAADVVEIEWENPAGVRTLTRGDADGSVWQGAPGLYRPEPTTYPVALTRGSGAVFGELRLCFRSQVRLPERERLAFATLGGALAAAMQNAYVHQQLQDMVEQVAHEAAHDGLTSLVNRRRLRELGDRALAGNVSGSGTGADGATAPTALTASATTDVATDVATDDADRAVALLLFNIHHFKQVNDTLGHEAGDEVLRSVAARLRMVVEPDETLARLGGDEFALLLPVRGGGVAAAAARGRNRAEALLTVVRTPLGVDGLELVIEASVGLVAAAVGDCDTVELLRRAENAMYRAKQLGQPVAEYDAERDAGSVDLLALASEMQVALAADDQIVIDMQPNVDLSTGQPAGAEVLVRWRHPRRGLLPPSEFITHLEHTDLIAPLTRRIVELALEARRSWVEHGIDIPVAVNLSARSLLDRDLPKDVARLLEQYGARPDRFVLEITETAMMSELDVVDDVLGALRELGVLLSLDDFGTGFSSLESVARVAVDEIKIDRRFVAGMARSLPARAIVRMTVELARTLGLRVIAEGVENAEQHAALASLGCHGAQGYHFFRPMSPDRAREAIVGWTGPPTGSTE